MMIRECALCLVLTPSFLFCQQASPSANGKVNADPEIVVVTGTFEPIPLSEANRSVLSLDTGDQPLLYNSVVDYLRRDPSINLEQRGIDGVQADLSIRGASFEQSLVLLNGLRINDAQTGHHNMDIPIPLEAMSRIEVLHGAGSTVYGADAVGGAVNFITATPTTTEMRTRIGFGSSAFNQQRIAGSFLGRGWSEEATGSRDSSSGFRPDRDYRSSSLSSETRFKTRLGGTDLIFAGSDRPFGADQFYGNFDSWERTKSWFAAISQDLGRGTTVAAGYRRHSDEFVLVRDNPAIYENNHVSQSWQATLRHTAHHGNSSLLTYGIDADGDVIDSNNLGHHSRNRGAGYLNIDVQYLHRLFVSLGVREELFSGGRAEFAPTFAGGLWLREGLRVRASVSRAFRLPTYTDLYYSDPANLGNPLLRPESAWDFEGGPEWNPGGPCSGELTLFRRLDRDDIDYVRYSAASPWQATNIHNLAFTGVEAIVRFRLPGSQNLEIGYTELYGSQQGLPGIMSKYVFNYASHNAAFSWLGQFKDVVSIRTRIGVTQRVGRDAYPIWDWTASRTNGRIRPYLQLSNVSNTGYQEIPGVSMPGRSVIGGVEVLIVEGKRREGKRPQWAPAIEQLAIRRTGKLNCRLSPCQ
jgi:outer membrane cobalamin receptor